MKKFLALLLFALPLAASAAEPGFTFRITTPSMPRSCASRWLSPSSTSMPRAGRTYLPPLMSWGTTRLTVSTGTAKPTPALAPLGLKMAVLMPMSLPAESRSGPPELPGLMAASVWIR